MLSLFGKTFGMLKNIAIIFINSDFLTFAIGTQEMITDTKLVTLIDPPGQLYPEFIFFPHFSWIYFVGIFYIFSIPPSLFPQYRLTKSDPDPSVGLIRINIMTLRSVTHWQNIISKECRFIPGRGQSNMAADLIRI